MTGTTVKMLFQGTFIKKRIKLAACNCAAVYTACHVTWTIVKNVVPGNSSSKPDQTGNDIKCVK